MQQSTHKHIHYLYTAVDISLLSYISIVLLWYFWIVDKSDITPGWFPPPKGINLFSIHFASIDSTW